MPGWELLGKEEKEALNEIFDKSNGIFYRYGFNKLRNNLFRVNEFENKVAEKIGVKHVLCVSSGTAALKLALIALGVKPGDEVITQSFTFIATVEAILEVGAKPVITEVDNSLNMDPIDLEHKITNRTKVIIPVHMAGVPAKMNEIVKIAGKYKIPILEDSAQAFGASYNGRWLGTIGKIGIYSLDMGKIITTGEGGLIVTDDTDLFLKCREYSDHGHECNPNLPRGEDTRTTWGFNYKSTELTGALGLAQLKKLDYILEKQRDNKNRIKEGIKHIENIKFREIPDKDGDASDTLIFYLDSRRKAKHFAKSLLEKGIDTKNLPDAVNWHFAGTWNHIFNDYPEYYGKNLEEVWKNSADFLRRAIAIPIFVKMSDEQIKHIISSIVEISEKTPEKLKIIGLIPARGGSKGVPRKNIKTIAGKPLIAWTIDAAKKSRLLNDFYVSTEDREISEIASNLGAKVIKRPKELASDDSLMDDVIKHAVKETNADVIVLLQPTSPIRSEGLIDACISKFIKSDADNLATGFFSNMFEYGSYRENRQKLKPFFHDDGNIYIWKSEIINNNKRIGKVSEIFLTKRDENIEIDEEFDFWIAEKILEKFNKK